MLHIHQQNSRPIADAVLRAMFSARKSVFVDLLKWQVPVLEGTYEIDQFDTEHARYIVLADHDGDHLGSARLLPTMQPHILDSLYGELCVGEPPRGSAIFEITRFCLNRNLRSVERRAVRNTLVTALVDHALAAGIESYTAIAEMAWFQQILAFGWRCRPLGLPKVNDGSMLVAFRIEISTDTPRLLQEAGIVAVPTLLDASAPLAA